MRVLLDECIPRRLKRALSEHDVRTVPEMGWAATDEDYRGTSPSLARLFTRREAIATIDRLLAAHRQDTLYQEIATGIAAGVAAPSARTRTDHGARRHREAT